MKSEACCQVGLRKGIGHWIRVQDPSTAFVVAPVKPTKVIGERSRVSGTVMPFARFLSFRIEGPFIRGFRAQCLNSEGPWTQCAAVPDHSPKP